MDLTSLNYYYLEDTLTCSFDEPCSWNGLKSWKKSFHNFDNSSFFEGKISTVSVRIQWSVHVWFISVTGV